MIVRVISLSLQWVVLVLILVVHFVVAVGQGRGDGGGRWWIWHCVYGGFGGWAVLLGGGGKRK